MELFPRAVAFVDAAHIKVDVPSLRLDSIDHLRDMRGDTDQGTSVTDALAVFPDLLQFPLSPEDVGEFSVMSDADGTRSRQSLQHLGIIRAFTGQRDILHVPTLLYVERVGLQVDRAGLPGVNACGFALCQQLLHTFWGEVAFHLSVDKAG